MHEELHCMDGSDEQECRLVVPTLGYNKNLIPPPLQGDKYLYVNISYNFKKILYIDENENFIRISTNLQKDWYDSLLTFQNLKMEKVNSVFQDDMNMIWIPMITMKNIENAEKEKKADNEEIFKVVPNDEFKFQQNSKTNYQNALLFEELNCKSLFHSFCNLPCFRDPKITFHRIGAGQLISFVILSMNGIPLIHKVVMWMPRF